MINLGKWLLQAVAYMLFFAVVGYFSTEPAYTYLPEGQAELKLAFKHAAKRQEKCRKRSHEELMQLAPNMRAANACSRQRSPLLVELLLDGNRLAKKVYTPPGLHGDGAAYVYEKFSLPSGEHLLTIHMRDTIKTEGYDHTLEKRVMFESSQALVVGFDGSKNGFIFY